MLRINKKTLILFLLMLALELIMATIILKKFGFNFYQGGDSPGYMLMAKNWLEHGVISFDATSPYHPTNFRTPGYLLFLMIIYLIFHSFVPAMFFGALISAFAAPLIYLIAREIFSEKIAFGAGILTAVEPMGLFLGVSILTEGIFTPILFLSIYYFIKYLKRGNVGNLWPASFLFGLSSLIRPIMFYFWPFAVPFIIYKSSNLEWRSVFKNAAVFVAIFFAVLSPWLIRNRISLKSWQFTGLQGELFYVDHYGAVLRYLDKTESLSGIINNAIAIVGLDKRFTPESSDILFKLGLDGIKEHKFAYANVYAKSLISFFIANGYKSFFIDILGIPAKAPYIPFELFLRFDFKSISKTFSEMDAVGFLIYWGSKLFWVAVFISFLASLIYLFFDERYKSIRAGAAFIAVAIFYFALITGPTAIGGGRTKAPVNGLIFIFAVFGWFKIFGFIKRKFT